MKDVQKKFCFFTHLYHKRLDHQAFKFKIPFTDKLFKRKMDIAMGNVIDNGRTLKLKMKL